MKTKIHPHLLKILVALFPNENPMERYNKILKAEKDSEEFINKKNKNDADTVSAPSIN